MKKINFKQGKYIFPLVILLPLIGLIYYVVEIFTGNEAPEEETDSINMNIPAAQAPGVNNKLTEMTRRYGEEDAYTAIGYLGTEQQEYETIEQGYSDRQLDSIAYANAERERMLREAEELERSMMSSRRSLNSRSYSYSYDEEDDYAAELERINRAAAARQQAIDRALGLNQPQSDTVPAQTVPKPNPAPEPELVTKSNGTNLEKFNTISSSNSFSDSPLIRAMIDQTTKAHEGTRLRFKLLDDVEVKGVQLPKGTYLYGTVTGFGQQRVKANITSILIGSEFIRVNLAVFDNDGMEGFYVPESAFRDFMRDAGAGAMQQNININSGYGSEISGEAIALQALQNMYTSATNAVSANIRKNKAKIKYNTIVYLINSNNAR